MGSEKKTTTTSSQQSSASQNSLQQLLTSGPGELEQFLSGQIPGAVNQISDIAAGFGAMADRLSPQVQQLLGQFDELPGIGTAFGFLEGGRTADQRRMLDRATRRITQGGRDLFDASQEQAFARAANAAGGLAGQYGVGGLEGIPLAAAARDATFAGAQLAANEQNVRGQVGQTMFQGAVGANQALMGNLLNLTGQIAQLRGQGAGLYGAVTDIADRGRSIEQQFRLATGRQVSSGSSTASQTGRQQTTEETSQSLGSTLLQAGLGAGMMFGTGGMFPGAAGMIGSAAGSIGSLFSGGGGAPMGSYEAMFGHLK